MWDTQPAVGGHPARQLGGRSELAPPDEIRRVIDKGRVGVMGSNQSLLSPPPLGHRRNAHPGSQMELEAPTTVPDAVVLFHDPDKVRPGRGSKGPNRVSSHRFARFGFGCSQPKPSRKGSDRHIGPRLSARNRRGTGPRYHAIPVLPSVEREPRAPAGCLCRGQDLNLGTPSRADLESAAFGHSATPARSRRGAVRVYPSSDSSSPSEGGSSSVPASASTTSSRRTPCGPESGPAPGERRGPRSGVRRSRPHRRQVRTRRPERRRVRTVRPSTQNAEHPRQ